MGYMRCARILTPPMRQWKRGRVVNIIGRSGHQPRPNYIAGGAVNASLLSFTHALAAECAPDNVLITGVNPGSIATPRWDALPRPVGITTRLFSLARRSRRPGCPVSVSLGERPVRGRPVTRPGADPVPGKAERGGIGGGLWRPPAAARGTHIHGLAAPNGFSADPAADPHRRDEAVMHADKGYERRENIHLAFTTLGCALICLNQIRRFC